VRTLSRSAAPYVPSPPAFECLIPGSGFRVSFLFPGSGVRVGVDPMTLRTRIAAPRPHMKLSGFRFQVCANAGVKPHQAEEGKDPITLRSAVCASTSLGGSNLRGDRQTDSPTRDRQTD